MKIKLVEYNPEWINMYENMKDSFLISFGDKIAGIEHIGSTSVPGLGAKPIIDILLGVRKLSDADEIIPDMEKLGFEYVSKYEDEMPNRRYFVKRENGKNIYHIHTVEVNSPFWRRHIFFRDFLRNNPEVRDDYYKLKKELSGQEWESSNDYADAKTEFIRNIEAKATVVIKGKAN
jgi:GrpB-like predicted nucleotidyltransferase (UPF0157 family)